MHGMDYGAGLALCIASRLFRASFQFSATGRVSYAPIKVESAVTSPTTAQSSSSPTSHYPLFSHRHSFNPHPFAHLCQPPTPPCYPVAIAYTIASDKHHKQLPVALHQQQTKHITLIIRTLLHEIYCNRARSADNKSQQN